MRPPTWRSRYRMRAWLLGALCLVIVPLALWGEKLPTPVTALAFLGQAVLLLTPFLGFLGLLLLAKRALDLDEASPDERQFARVLFWLLGPIGCFVVVLRATRSEQPRPRRDS